MNYTNDNTNDNILTITYVETNNTIKLCINDITETEIFANCEHDLFDNYKNKNIAEINVINEKYFKNQLSELNQIKKFLLQYIYCVDEEFGDDNGLLEKLSDFFDFKHENLFNVIKNKSINYNNHPNAQNDKLFSINYLFEIAQCKSDTNFNKMKTFVNELKNLNLKFKFEKNASINNNIFNIIKFYINFIEKLIIDKIDDIVIYIVNEILNNATIENIDNCNTNICKNLDNCSNLFECDEFIKISDNIYNLKTYYDKLNKYSKNIYNIQNKIKNINNVDKIINKSNKRLLTTVTNCVVNIDNIIDDYYYYIITLNSVNELCENNYKYICNLKMKQDSFEYGKQIENIMNEFKIELKIFTQ